MFSACHRPGAVAACLTAALALVGCNRSPAPPDTAETELAAAWGPAGAPAPTWRPGTTEPLHEELSVQNPYTRNEAAIAEGERLFNWYNCAGCHSPGAGGGMGPPLIDPLWIYGSDDARVFESIWNGRQAGMPAWAGIIPQDDVWKIVAFIREAPRRNTWPWNGDTGAPPGGAAETGGNMPAPASTGASSVEPAMSPGPLTVDITARHGWWDILYRGRDGAADARTANELHLPAGRTVRLVLRSGDTAHRFCAPIVEDAIDLEAGREVRVDVQVDEPGTSVGVCRSRLRRTDTQMRILVVAQSAAAFDEWLSAQRMPAPEPAHESASRGRDAFLERGCLVCHTIRGTPARGRVAPDLTHVAGRRQIANGVLDNRIGNYEAWIAGNESIKPGNQMPAFKELDGATLRALGSYLDSLR